MVIALITEAQEAGARFEKCCEIAGIDPRTVQRWRAEENGGEDHRKGPNSVPANKLSDEELKQVIKIATSPEFRDKSPQQIVPILADRGIYIASESTFYRALRAEGMMGHRGRSKAPTSRRPKEKVATGPCQVWSWDITYLKSPITGEYYYLYLIMDVWSRMIVGYAVHEEESMELASELLKSTANKHDAEHVQLVLHSDNGAPMKGSTMKATMERLGVIPSFSRPHVSDDNPYSESLFRTLKYRPNYPTKPYESLAAAQAWTDGFVTWYNTEHLHSAITFVTPKDRHQGRADAIMEQRHRVYEDAKKKHQERWGKRSTRKWQQPSTVVLNPQKLQPTPLQNPIV